MEINQKIVIDHNSVFDQDGVSLLSHINVSLSALSSKKALKFHIKINNSLCELKHDSHDPLEDFIKSLQANNDRYKPLVIVGPSGAGKVIHYFSSIILDLGYSN